jgi:tetratricopeptide (TPR) repeat protein
MRCSIRLPRSRSIPRTPCSPRAVSSRALWPTQREPLERLAGALPAHRPDLRVEALTMLGAVQRHLGSPDESLALLDAARALVLSPEGDESIPDAARSEIEQHSALTLARLVRFGDAARTARDAIRLAERGHHRGERLKAHGCAGLVELARGRPERAVAHQERALELVLRHRPASAPRTIGYLVEALGAAGRVADARRAYRRALALLDADARSDKRGSREAWLRTALAGALEHAGRSAETIATLDDATVRDAIAHAPQPGLDARRLLARALCERGESERGFALLAASPTAHGRVQVPHVGFLAHANVLDEARLRAEHGALDADAIARARGALAWMPGYEAARSHLAAPRDRAERALAGGRPDQIAHALASLLARAAPLR